MTSSTSIDHHMAAIRRAAEAKKRMDEAQAELDKAEDEYHQAHLELDRLEGYGDGELGHGKR